LDIDYVFLNISCCTIAFFENKIQTGNFRREKIGSRKKLPVLALVLDTHFVFDDQGVIIL
jgi:hypothetical protein